MSQLEISSLSVSYGAVTAVRNVDLRVEPGELVALIGPNGAGKTTTLAAIAGRVRVRAGDIRYEGASILGRGPEDNVADGIALVPEGRHIFTRLTVAENLALGATVRQDADVETDIERELERFPVLRRLYRSNAGKLSGGEQQQLAIARAVLSRPRLLLLDEPSLGLAPKVIAEVFAYLRELRGDGVAVLLVEQHIRRAIELADRAYVMSSGRIVLEGTSSSLTDRDAIESAYLGGNGVEHGGR